MRRVARVAPGSGFVVLCRKTNGTDVIFSRYPQRGDAELIVERLRMMGCAARCEPARLSDVPGLTRH